MSGDSSLAVVLPMRAFFWAARIGFHVAKARGGKNHCRVSRLEASEETDHHAVGGAPVGIFPHGHQHHLEGGGVQAGMSSTTEIFSSELW